MNRTNGRIAEQSRERLLAALLKIMELYDYREITVTQIVQEAGLSRNTFYRLFRDKDELTELLFQKLFREFYGRISEKQVQSFWQLMELYFDFWEERRELLELLRKNNLLRQVLEQSYEHSPEVFSLVHARDSLLSGPLPLQYLLAFSVGGMQNMLVKWVESGMDIPARELISKLRACLMYEGLPEENI